MRRVWIPFLAIVLLALPAVAQQDDRGPISWLAYSKIKPGMTDAAVNGLMEEKELMDKLVADGHVVSWGAAVPINHTPDQAWNFLEWVTVRGWADVEAWAGTVMGKMAAMSEKEQEEQQEKMEAIFVQGSHFDEVVRHPVVSRGDGTAPRYFYAAEFAAQPGQADSLEEFFKDAVVPLLDPMVADGILTSYGVYRPELHIDADWTHRFWYGLPDLASVDKMTKTFNEAQSPAFDAWAGSVFDLTGHSDTVWMVLHYGQ